MVATFLRLHEGSSPLERSREERTGRYGRVDSRLEKRVNLLLEEENPFSFWGKGGWYTLKWEKMMTSSFLEGGKASLCLSRGGRKFRSFLFCGGERRPSTLREQHFGFLEGKKKEKVGETENGADR